MTLTLISAHAAGILAKSGGITLDPIAKPLAAVLAFFYSLIPNYGAAIVILTIAMMLVLTPLTIKQTRSMLVMQKLQPQLKRLQEVHKNDRQALNEAVMALYKEHNASPLGGCLPMILPLPVFIALLRVLEGLSRQVKGHSVPKYLTAHTRMYLDIQHSGGQLGAFGMNLAKSASNVGGSLPHKLPYFVLLVVMVGTQYYQQHQLTSRNPQAAAQPGQAMMKFIPIFFGVISLNFPAGVVIYWTVSNMIRIVQQWAMYQYDPKVRALVAKDIKEVEAKTREIDAREGQDSAEGKPPRQRLRDLFNNASDAAAGRNGQKPGGKSAPKPGDKGPPSGPGGRKGLSPRPGTKGSGAKGGDPKRADPKGTTDPRGTTAKPPSKPSSKQAAAKPAAASKPGPAKPVAGGTTKPKAPSPKNGGTSKPAPTGKNGQGSPPATGPPAKSVVPPMAPGNPAASPPSSDTNGSGSSGGNGSSSPGVGSPGAGSPSAGAGTSGRTGGGSSRSIPKRRRTRRGR